MTRVARTGARILVIEPDWQTLVIQGGDRLVTRAVVDFHCDRIRHGQIGRRLLGMFRDALLEEVRVSAETLIVTDLALADTIFALRETARAATQAGAIAEGEAAEFLAALERSAARGHFLGCLTGFLAVGRTPSEQRRERDVPGPVNAL